MRREHTNSLNKQAINIIEIMKSISGHCEYVFPTLKTLFNKHMNKETVNTVLKRMGFKGELVAHGFDYDYDLIEVSLAHVDRECNESNLQ